MEYLRFAKNALGNIVNVRNVTDAYIKDHGNESFTCLGCGNTMLTKRGKVREWHFAHVGGKDVKCSYETYLHKLGITTFIEIYNKKMHENKQFLLEIEKGSVCHYNECPYGRTELCRSDDVDYEIISILPDFCKVEREVKDGNFIPDILLSAKDGRKIYVEIAVTHFSEQSKIGSGIPIVEFELNCDKDMSLFTENCITSRNKSVKMFNFSNSMDKVDYGCESFLQEAKNQFISNFRKHFQDGTSLNLEHPIEIVCGNERCPYIVDHSCCVRYEYFDIAKNCKELSSNSVSKTFSPDFYLEKKDDGKMIRFNFSYGSFLSEKKENLMPTIQFALDDCYDLNSGPWTFSQIKNSVDGVRFYNFDKLVHTNLCEEGLNFFELIVLDKKGQIQNLPIGRIKGIYEYMSNKWDDVDDYILIPAPGYQEEHSFPDSLLKLFFEKNCKVCSHCVKKREKDSRDYILSCKLNKKEYDEIETKICDSFERNLEMKNGRACCDKYRGYEKIIEAWRRYRLKK